ncbi:MAG: 4Fe-4S binding protein [Lentisphaeria bacterium]|nr:4Fe-4S binding protein [Lentisphaeria bacterium]
MAAKVDKEKCCGCESCVNACPVSAISMADGAAQIDEATCIECGACVGECPCEAISL